MNVHLRLHLEGLEPVLARLDELKALMTQQWVKDRAQGAEIMATLDDVKAQVTATADAEAAAVLLLNHLHELLTAAQSDPAALQAVIDQLAASKEQLAAAIVANTVA